MLEVLTAARVKKALACLILAFLAIGLFVPATLALQNNKKKVLLLVASSLNLNDIQSPQLTNISQLIKKGAFGLMNSRPANISQPASFYLTIGAGARAEASPLANLGFNDYELIPADINKSRLLAKEFFYQTNGLMLQKNNAVNFGINDSADKNIKYHNNIVAGLLGQALKDEGKKIAAIGNADTVQELHREITLITMDKKGITGYGNLRAGAIKDNDYPGGIRTDYKKLATETIDQLNKRDLIAVELGNSARLDYQRPYMPKKVFEQRKRQALLQIDQFIGQIISKADKENTMVILLGPKPGPDMINDRNYLTPVIFYGLGSGTITSGTTNRDGLIANIDIAPTVLNYLEVGIPLETAGNVAKTVAARDTLSFINKRHDQIAIMRLVRTPFIVTYSLLLIMAMTFALAFIRLKSIGQKISAKATNTINFVLLFLLAIPISSLLQIPLQTNNMAFSLSSTFLIALALALAANKISSQGIGRLLIIAGITVGLVIVDAFTGTNLGQRSYFGSDLISGGRYYGIGNVYMGTLIGAAVFSAGAFADLKAVRKGLLAIGGLFFLLAVAIVIGHPSIGANIGGLVTAAVTALVFWQVMRGKKISAKAFSVSLIVFVFIALALLGIDLQNEQAQSHAGKSLKIIQAKGPQAVTDIIFRKINQNVRDTKSFSGFLLMSMFALAIMLNISLKNRKGVFGQFKDKFPALNKAFVVMIWAAIIGYAFNDTGAVTAVAIASYLLLPVLYLSLDSHKQEAA